MRATRCRRPRAVRAGLFSKSAQRVNTDGPNTPSQAHPHTAVAVPVGKAALTEKVFAD